eukprot:scaffold13225_cov112-Isochrysis_galbana.AAC.1
MSSSRLLCTAAMTVVPHNFGGRDGPCITNKDTVLNEVDAALTINRPPGELLAHTCPSAAHLTRTRRGGCLRPSSTQWRIAPLRLRTSAHHTRPHANVRGRRARRHRGAANGPHFRHVDARNARDARGRPPVRPLRRALHHLRREAARDEHPGRQAAVAAQRLDGQFLRSVRQGGAYNRPIVGVRIERVADGAMDAMHAYFLALDAKSKVGNGLPGLATPGSDSRGAARFQLVEMRLSSIMRQVPEPISRVLGNVLEFLKRAQSKPDPSVPPADAEHGGAKAVRMVSEMAGDLDAVRASSFTAGNCAQWTSSGLEFAGLIRRSRLFPKSILIEVRGVEAISVESDGVSSELDALSPSPSFPSVARVRALEAAVKRARGVLRPGGARHPTRPPVAAREARVRPPALPRQEPPLCRHAQVCRRGGEAGPLPACGMWEAVGVCIMGGGSPRRQRHHLPLAVAIQPLFMLGLRWKYRTAKLPPPCELAPQPRYAGPRPGSAHGWRWSWLCPRSSASASYRP